MNLDTSTGDLIESAGNSREVPDVSIIVAVHNDEGWIGAALQSCLDQTWSNFEVICIDDASTDGTREVVKEFQARDPRVLLFEQEVNQSAFQARRVGVLEAKAQYVLFLDGDDELAPDTVRRTLETARSEGADLVGFGVTVVAASGDHPKRFESDLQHKHSSLDSDQIVTGLFPVGSIAQGHLWRYLWDINLLRGAYNRMPSDLRLYRANDLPIVFLGAACASKYVSIEDRLYRYWFRRGGSGSNTVDKAAFRFYLSALDSIEAIEDGVRQIAEEAKDPSALFESYTSARLSVIQVILRYGERVQGNSGAECLSMLVARVGPSEVVRAAATFFPGALSYLARNESALKVHGREKLKNVLIMAGNLASGGVQGVVVSQANQLLEAGFNVTVAVRTLNGLVHELPPSVPLIEIDGETSGRKVSRYLDILNERHIDIAIDHWVLYKDDWPFFSLAASSIGVSTIGWLHNFALRPVFDFNTRTSFLTEYLPLLRQVVTLSAADVAFWKLRGMSHTVYLPNPPSPMLLERPDRENPRSLDTQRPLRLVWWGRIQQHTKRVRDLIEVAADLQVLDVDFHLTIIGPDSADLTSEQLQNLAVKRGVDDRVSLPGPLHGGELLTALEDADIYVCTSAIEGYPLTLIEAQAMGLPVAMYELPWLAVAQDNMGLATTKQGDHTDLARLIAQISRDPKVYNRLSRGSLDASSDALSHNFAQLYSDLITGKLSPALSPEPSLDMAELLLDRSISFQEQSSAREGRYQTRILNQLTSEQKETTSLKKRNNGLENRISSTQKDLARLRNWITTLKEQNRIQQQELRRLRDWNTKLKNETISLRQNAAQVDNENQSDGVDPEALSRT